MMEKIITQYFCDVCKKEAKVQRINYPVVFHTEQAEGRTVVPYIEQQTLDMCPSCISKTLMLDGYGAQGLNRYFVRGKEDI